MCCLRCNSQPDCYDLSDEFDCKIINPGQSYQSFIAPPPISQLQDNQTLVENKVFIDISTDIVRILDIDEISGIFHVQFYLHFSWFDSRFVDNLIFWEYYIQTF